MITTPFASLSHSSISFLLPSRRPADTVDTLTLCLRHLLSTLFVYFPLISLLTIFIAAISLYLFITLLMTYVIRYCLLRPPLLFIALIFHGCHAILLSPPFLRLSCRLFPSPPFCCSSFDARLFRFDIITRHAFHYFSMPYISY